MPPHLLRYLKDSLNEIFPLAADAEFTIEVNPEDVTPEFTDALLHAGVNRVSMGVQTFIDTELSLIGRRHTSAQTLDAYALLAEKFGNISIDLMFGLPDQSLDSWRQTVSTAIALQPAHISAYSLMWEERTAIMAMRRQGKVHEAPQATSAEMFALINDALPAAGYHRYEISNYALSDKEARHNRAYWDGTPYLGLGPGAHSYDGGRIRRANPPHLQEYIKNFLAAEPSVFYEQETLDDEELHEEYIMTRLRRARGIDLADYARRFGEERAAGLLHKAKGMPHLLDTGTSSIALSTTGVMLSDTAIVGLFD